MSGCAFAALAAGTAALEGKESDRQACTEPVAHCVRLAQDVATGYQVEHFAKVCDKHEEVAAMSPGYLRSTKIRAS